MEQPEEQKESESPRKKSGCVIAGIVVGAVLLGIGILLVVAYFFVRSSSMLEDPDVSKAAVDLQMIEASLIRYRTFVGVYPTDAQGLDALVRKPTEEPVPRGWKQLMEPGGLIDPWGQAYHYRYPGVRNPDAYDVWSSGPDQVEGTSDDIFAD